MLFLHFHDFQIALACNVPLKTYRSWQNSPEFLRVRVIEIEHEIPLRRRIWNSEGYWQGACWYLERKYPNQFAKPEIQLAVNNSYTQNSLSLTISGPELKEIEADAKPVREKVSKMLEHYRESLGNGNGDQKPDT